MAEPAGLIAVIIPTLNEAAHIEATIRALQTPDLAWTIYVADGGSTDGTQDIVAGLADLRVTLVHNPGKLQSAGVNEVVRKLPAQVEIFVRCDAHAVYPDGFIRKVTESLVETGAASVVVPMKTIGAVGFQGAVAIVSNSVVGTGGARHRAGLESGWVDHGHHAGFRRDAFEAVGGYDAEMSHCEDSDLDSRFAAAGYRVYLDARCTMEYIPRATPAKLARQYFNYGRGRAVVVRRYRKIRLRQLVVPMNLVLLTVSVLAGLVWTPALAYLAVYLAFLIGVSLAYGYSQSSKGGALTGLAAGVMHLSWAAGFFTSIIKAPAEPKLIHDA